MFCSANHFLLPASRYPKEHTPLIFILKKQSPRVMLLLSFTRLYLDCFRFYPQESNIYSISFQHSIMKKAFFTLVAILLFSFSQACEICGCGMDNYYIGFLPQFNHQFFGVRYSFNSFHTRLSDDPTQFSDDFFQTVDLWGGWNIGRKFQLLAFVPYNFNHQVSDEGTENLKGFGDVALFVNYNLWQHTSASGKASHQLWIGGGIKLPTGKFAIDPDDPDVAAAANKQLGSKSTDYMVDLLYNVRFGKVGINTSVNYKMNTANSKDYKFGNKLTASSFVYYPIAAGAKTVVSPNAGLLYEHTGSSQLNKTDVSLTGGSLLNGAVGAEVSFSKMALGFNVQLPLAQNFAEDQTKQRVRGMFHVSFAL